MANFKGGYKLIDLKGANLAVGSPAVKVEGIYESIEHSYRKPTILCNMVLAGVERPDRFVNFGMDGTSFAANIGLDNNATGLNIVITDADMVSVIEI